MRIREVLLGATLVLATATASAQLWPLRSGDQLTLTINHPPAIKAPIEHIAFTQPAGPCSEAFSDALVADFATSGAIVIDRLHLKNIVEEHKLNASGLVNAKTAAKLGRLIGAGSLVFIKVHECKTSHTREPKRSLDAKGNISKDLMPTTRATLKASVQIIDMTTGVTIAAKLIDAKAAVQLEDRASMRERFLATAASLRPGEDKGESDLGDYPPDDEAHSAVFVEAVTQVHRAMLPWTETKKVHFYNDRECGLGNAYSLLQTADYEGAARAALTSVEECQSKGGVKPQQLARAHFNRGMTLLLLNDHLAALKEFGQALRLDIGNKVFLQVMQEANKAWSAAQSQGLTSKKGTSPKSSSTSSTSTTTKTADTGKGTAEERLKKLDELHKKKMITDAEYEKKRKQILEDI